ncbi:hypothetical protein [Acinetobacter sp. WCHAc060042]|uniref:hypothetical protein n=1 Tax=Acinetobacter sp. WCHAc060042 TaxID=2213016 RepID=UPI000DA64789|nr:hypothetical protein [Acinetobacter sp. WCHAc060042]
MAVSHITVLSLLGKEVSFSVLIRDEIKDNFPEGIHVRGVVETVAIALNGNHEILVCGQYYDLSEIDLKI